MIYMQKSINNCRVLFLVQQYMPNPKSCELCVMRVQEALLNLGIKSDVLEVVGDKGLIQRTMYGEVHSIGSAKPILNTTRRNIFNKIIYKASVIFTWPITMKKKSRKELKKYIDFLDSKYTYAAIIGVTLPVDAPIVGAEYDKFILYELDAVANNPEYKRGVKKLYKFRLSNIEKYLYNHAKLIIHMKYNERYLERYKNISTVTSKSVYADIPNLVKSVFIGSESSYGEKVLFAYFGGLVKDYRNPEYLIAVVNEINKQMPIECDFFSRGNCEDILEKAHNNAPDVIKKKGYVDKEKVLEIQNKADVLVSIGNRLTGTDYSLPSKIIDYIATGKPILHISGGSNDSAISYLERYDLACIIDPNDVLDENVRKVITFVKKNKGRVIPFDKIFKEFYHNSPDYTARIIKDFIQ